MGISKETLKRLIFKWSNIKHWQNASKQKLRVPSYREFRKFSSEKDLLICRLNSFCHSLFFGMNFLPGEKLTNDI